MDLTADAPSSGADEVDPHADLLATVRALVPELARDAADVEVNGAVDSSVIDRLDEAGLFRMFRPARYGGAEADPEAFFRAIRLLSRGCFATGWVSSLIGAHEWHLSLFDERAQEDVWAEGKRALITSSYTPDGLLTPTRGGFRLSGRWRTATGVHHADWSFLGALLLDEGGEPVDYVGALVPAADYTVEESWDPTGLRAVAADAVVVSDAFVPEYRTFGWRERTRQQDPESAGHLAPVHRMPYATIHTHAVAMPIVGAAEGAYAALVAERPEADGLPAVSRAVVGIEASWAQLSHNLAVLMDHARANAAPDTELVIRSRRDQVMAAERSLQAIGVFLDAAGTEAWGRRHPLQRAWREAQVARTNAANAVEDTLSIYGRWAYGLDIGDRWW
ncbi:acyl-CoA dehydrogenase [Nocardioides immobilis]|uniref:Acyl-CoA dehydrogenase n=1 Tax=Nocardioides immobilis TaxID=2049295 RepID=A0A417XT55_9ACTN|nr:acyl-CoA dehydrogenase family protein [Nocardioides immobilis]RHW23485.1 acyl-CoA dehydrogenase [Nocardioides immobilis]